MIKNYGYIEPVLEQNNYFSGTLPDIIINPSGDWRPYCTNYEPQFGVGFDTSDCTIFGNENAITITIKNMFGMDVDYSERYISNLMYDQHTGLDPHSVLETMRKNGMLNQEELPFTSTLTEFDTPRPIPKTLIDKASTWGYDLKHEYVFVNSPDKETRLVLMREHLKYSPLPCSVTAWMQDNDGLYIDNGLPNTHWCVCVYIDDKGVMYMYDSYDLIINGTSTALIKQLHPDHHIQTCKRLYIVAKEMQVELSWIQKMLNWIAEQLNLIQTKSNMTTISTQPINSAPALVSKPEIPVVTGFLWDTTKNVKHSIRVICDEEGLTVEQKNTMCATIGAESGYNPKVKNENKINGKTVSTDWGLCQWNDYYHGKEITPDESINNPEKAVRLMCSYWKRGQRNLWIAYKNGSYQRYL